MNDAAHPDAIQANDSATLHYPGGVAEFPIVHGTDGASAIDVSTLTRDTGLTYRARSRVREHRVNNERDHLHRW